MNALTGTYGHRLARVSERRARALYAIEGPRDRHHVGAASRATNPGIIPRWTTSLAGVWRMVW